MIEAAYKNAYTRLQEKYGKYGVPEEESDRLSAIYKKQHQELIDRRKADEAKRARMQAFDATHSERLCRGCKTQLAPHHGRGRPAVRCEKCRELAK